MMILGISTSAFTELHVIISLLAIASGLVAVTGLVRGRLSGPWTATFLATTVATSATGFLFHSKAIGPPHIVGGLSLVILGLALFALYRRRLVRHWRSTFIVCAALALYLNVFVAVVQAFQKIPPLHGLAPNGSEPPFLATQAFVLVACVALGVLAVRRDLDTA